jgi:ABC-type sugar transport system ATPase subunit
LDELHSQRKKAQILLDQFDIDVSFSYFIEEYPLSVRQMIEIAKALVYEARIIIMDEPTSALTYLEVSRLFEIIMDLKIRRKCSCELMK